MTTPCRWTFHVICLLAPLLLQTSHASLTYEITVSIRNLAPSEGTCQTPVWIGFHDGTFDVYNREEAASPALERIAEDGNAEPLVQEFSQSDGGYVDGVVGGGPLCPNEAAERRFLVEVPDDKGVYVSYTSMVLPSNDAFIANGDPMAHKVADEFGNVVFQAFSVAGSEVLDAGTEVNSESEDSTAFLGQSAPNTGEEEPEGSVVDLHPGFLEDGPILEAFSGGDFTAEGYEMMSVRLRATLVTRRVEVTVAVTNMAPEDGTCQTPVWIGLHDGRFDSYNDGEEASVGIERIAEDGDAGPLGEEFVATPGFSLLDKVAGKVPLCPGESASTRMRIDIPLGKPLFLSYASMVLPSNDAFIANGNPQAHPIFDEQGDFVFEDFVVAGSEVNDAGTEVNDELEATTAFLGQSEPNTGEDENGVIGAHPGFLDNGRILDAFPRADFTADDYQMLKVSASAFIITRPYMVTITATNRAPSEGTCQTPVWVGIHNGMFDIYDRNEPASEALERIAEDGTTGPLSEAFADAMGTVVDAVVSNMPLCPGETAIRRITVNVPLGMSLYLSYASMVLPSNDAFIANGNPTAHRIFDSRADFVLEDFTVLGSEVLDAGTEENDEAEASTAFLGQTAPDTGNDQADGVVTLHPGFVDGGRIFDSFPGATFTEDGYETLSLAAMANKVVEAKLYAVTVTITNEAPAEGTCQTPVWVGFHDGMFDVYNREEAASEALERIAEDGNAAPLIADFATTMGTLVDGVVGEAPICPGESASATFLVNRPPNRGVYFSYTSMVLPSNDAFIANGDPMAHRVFDPTDGSFAFESFTVMGSEVLDAGTEVNDEQADNTAFLGQEEPDTGTDENGVVSQHVGFQEGGPILTSFAAANFLADDYETIRVMQSAVEAPALVRTILRPRLVVPPVDRGARANLKLRLFSNGDIAFRMKFRVVQGVVSASLYRGPPGENGPLVMSLFTSNELLGKSSGRFAVRGMLEQKSEEGSMTNEMGLWRHIMDESLYVLVVTEANPDGGLRGDLSFSAESEK